MEMLSMWQSLQGDIPRRPAVKTLFVVLLLTALGFGSTQKPERDIVAQFHENPYAYIFGTVEDVGVYEYNHEQYTQVRLVPIGTVIEEVITFCGEPEYNWKIAVVMLTYERIAHGSASMPCHTMKPRLSLNLVPAQ
jgi:hypothetical protein